MEGVAPERTAAEEFAIYTEESEARKRTAMKRYAQMKISLVNIQKEARRRLAKRLVAKRLAVIHKRQYALRMGYFAVRIAKTLDVRANQIVSEGASILSFVYECIPAHVCVRPAKLRVAVCVRGCVQV